MSAWAEQAKRLKKPSRKCHRCGQPCTSKDSTKYCSRSCAFAVVTSRAVARRAREQRPCARCGSTLSVKSRGRVLAKRYCSQACQRLALKERAEVRRSKRVKTCPKCGEQFTPRWIGRTWQKYCSTKCLTAKYRERAEVACATCGAKVSKMKAQARRASVHFCSVPCQRKYFVGDRHVQFRAESIGDPKRRGATGAWKRRSAEVRERDGHICRKCGKPWEPGVRKFPVDHVVPWRTFEDKSLADAPANLVTLCHGCHTRKTVNAEKRWLQGDVQAFEQFRKDVGHV